MAVNWFPPAVDLEWLARVHAREGTRSLDREAALSVVAARHYDA